MKISGSTDFEAPLLQAFEAFADFESFERHGLRAGVEVQRVDDLSKPDIGMMWKIKTDFRGKSRKVDIELVDFEPNQKIAYKAAATGFEGDIDIELVQLSLNRTRANVTLNVKATSLSARLVLQSVRLGKSAINKRYRARLLKFGQVIEDRYNSSTMA